jgi:hypothetical protein
MDINMSAENQSYSRSMEDVTNKKDTRISWSDDLIKRFALAAMIVLSVMNCCYFFFPGDPAKVAAYAFVRLIGPFIWSAFMVLFLQLFNRFRNTRSRWLIVLWVNAILCFSETVLIAQRVIGFTKSHIG